MYQDEPHYDIEGLTTGAEAGAETAVNITQGLMSSGNLPNLDYSTMPESTNVEDRRNEPPNTKIARKPGEGGQLLDDKDNKKEPDYSGLLEGAKTAGWAAWLYSLNKPYMGTVTGITSIPTVVGGVIAMYKMKSEILADVQKQLKAGVPPDKIRFEPGSAADGYGMFSKLQEMYGKPLEEIKPHEAPAQYMSNNKPGDKPLIDIPGGGVPSGPVKGRAEKGPTGLDYGFNKTQLNTLLKEEEEQLVGMWHVFREDPKSRTGKMFSKALDQAGILRLNTEDEVRGFLLDRRLNKK